MNETTSPARRLVIGEGYVGNGIQCGVDVSVVAENLAQMGLALNEAVNSPMCNPGNFPNTDGLVQSICTIDIGGAITYLSQAVTFIQLSIVNCADHLNVAALCGAAISGIITSAAGIAPFGAAINTGCALNSQAKAATGGGRRLASDSTTTKNSLEKLAEVTATLKAKMKTLGIDPAKTPSMKDQSTMPAANVNKLMDLVEPTVMGKSFRGMPSLPECQ